MTKITARDLMTPDPMVVDENLSAAELATFLLGNEISAAPVVNESGKLVGVVSLADIARSFSDEGNLLPERSRQPDFFLAGNVEDSNLIKGWEESYNQEDLQGLHVTNMGTRVRDIMTAVVVALESTATVQEIAASMISGHYHRLLVVEEGQVIGIISSMDLLRLLVDE